MTKLERARYGAANADIGSGAIPNVFPRTMGPNALKYLQEVVDSGLTSDITGRFERAFAAELGVKHCIATPGCTPALACLAAAFAFAPGDEIIVSPITDFGTIQGLVKENYIPVFADTAPGTVNISAETIAPVITDRTRAILVVHKTGLVCDMDAINALARRHGLIVYEDACQAVFSTYKGRWPGTLGRAAGFSFDAEKTLGSDVGGCVVTDDDDLAERVRFVGQSRGAGNQPGFGRTHLECGYAYRMTLCTAAVTLAQLEIIHEQVAQRDRMARRITEQLAAIDGVTPTPIPDYQEVYSAWMLGFSIDPERFRCDAAEFARQCAEKGLAGASLAQYYLMPVACKFLEENARNGVYPYSRPPAAREYHYNEETCPNAWRYLQNWIRWTSFSEKYQPQHCDMAAAIVREVAEANRR